MHKPTDLLYCIANIVIGNGTGNHSFTLANGYRLSTLQADKRLLPGQIRKYFRPSLVEAKEAHNKAFAK